MPWIGDQCFVEPLVLAGLVAADQQDGGSFWIKGIEHSERVTVRLDTQLAHVAVPGTLHSGGVRERQLGPQVVEQLDDGRNIVLLLLAQLGPPALEGSRLTDIPYPAFPTWNNSGG